MSAPTRQRPHAPSSEVPQPGRAPASRPSRPFRPVQTLLAGCLALAAIQGAAAPLSGARAAAPRLAITSVDTMKESRDTETRPLSAARIAADVRLLAALGPAYITVDTHWDYPAYMQQWVDAIRAAGKRVWFRIHPNQWQDNNGTSGIMGPAAYEASERAFLLSYPGLFRPGDILDPCPEPENGLYWKATYGSGWTAGAPNMATVAYNQFIRDTSAVADAALQQDGIAGVITTVRSTNAWIALHPAVFEAATASRMGQITIDSYPEGFTTDPATATGARIGEIAAIEGIWHLPVVLGEMGYSVKMYVDDATQHAVLAAEFAALATLPYLAGLNYWSGLGSIYSGGYTQLFSGYAGQWTARQASQDVAGFFRAYGAGN